MESIDDLLAQVKAEYEENDKPKEVKKTQPPKLEQPKPQPPVAPAYQPPTWEKKRVPSVENNLLAQVKAEFEEQEQVEQLRKQEQLREEQLKAEQRLKQQRDALRKEAQQWLKNLKPHSDDFLWFKEFATAYPSEIEAAIDYLQALRETGT